MSQASFDLARFGAEREARGLQLGEPAQWLASTASTSDDALAAARGGAAHGALFGAETQTQGRGRRGSAWVSTPGAGLWFSLVLRPGFSAELAPLIALAAGLAVRAAASELVALPVLVKWPNDVLVSQRKLAGLLVESQLSGTKLTSVVVGIGVNVSQATFPEPLEAIATSLALLQAKPLSREELLASILAQLEARLALLEARSPQQLMHELREHDALIGRRIRIDEREGTARGIDNAGRLLLENAAGLLEPCISGHVEILD